MKTLLITFLLNFIMLSASAHAVFIDRSLKGAKEKSHTVKVVYGEPDEHEARSKWWWYKAGVSKREKTTGQYVEKHNCASSMGFTGN